MSFAGDGDTASAAFLQSVCWWSRGPGGEKHEEGPVKSHRFLPKHADAQPFQQGPQQHLTFKGNPRTQRQSERCGVSLNYYVSSVRFGIYFFALDESTP